MDNSYSIQQLISIFDQLDLLRILQASIFIYLFSFGFQIMSKIIRGVRDTDSYSHKPFTIYSAPSYHYINADTDDDGTTEEEESTPEPIHYGACPKCGAPRKSNPCDYCGTYS